MVDKFDTKIYRILANLTRAQVSELDAIVKSGEYPSRSEAIREAIKLLLETKKLEKLEKKLG